MGVWLLAGIVTFGVLGVFANAVRCPTRHWIRGRCERGLGHRGDHVSGTYSWTTHGFARRSTR